MSDKLSDYLKPAAAAEFPGVSQNMLRTWAKVGFEGGPADAVAILSCMADVSVVSCDPLEMSQVM